MLPDRILEPPKPSAALLAVWDQASRLALEFRTRLADDDRVSSAFKALIQADGLARPTSEGPGAPS